MKELRKEKTNIVFSTQPDWTIQNDESQSGNIHNPAEQDLRIHLERKGGGKYVTVIKGFRGSLQEMKSLGQVLKRFCGAGGTIKHNNIHIQGNVRNKVLELLLSKGYHGKLSGG